MDAIVVGFVLKVLLPPLQEDILLTTLLVKKLLFIHEVQIPTQKGVNQIFSSSTVIINPMAGSFSSKKTGFYPVKEIFFDFFLPLLYATF